MSLSHIDETSRDPGGLVALSYEAGDATVIALSGELRFSTVTTLHDRLCDALDRGRETVVLDLHLVRSVESEALDLMWVTLGRMISRGARLAAVGGRDSLQGDLEPLVARGLSFHPTVHSALSDSDRPGAAA